MLAAEEGGFGKDILLDHGAYNEMVACIMLVTHIRSCKHVRTDCIRATKGVIQPQDLIHL